ncbi:MAG TPA: hypothetical protein VGQ89_14750 [Candidatus Limnocylindrales bacterium]|jgi:hypothetical protein|nr:hypothetical protein [Candidatus Limnocylindrales bacterium]
MILERVPRPTVRWAMELGPIDELCRFVAGAVLWGTAGWIGASIGIGLGRIVAGWIGL